MLEGLITSAAKRKMLALFFMNPKRKFYVREVQKNTGENINAVSRELAKLQKSVDIDIILDLKELDKCRKLFDVTKNNVLNAMMLAAQGKGKEALSALTQNKNAKQHICTKGNSKDAHPTDTSVFFKR